MDLKSGLKAITISGVVLFGLVLGSGEVRAMNVVSESYSAKAARHRSNATDLRKDAYAAKIAAIQFEKFMDQDDISVEEIDLYKKEVKRQNDSFLLKVTQAQREEILAQEADVVAGGINRGIAREYEIARMKILGQSVSEEEMNTAAATRESLESFADWETKQLRTKHKNELVDIEVYVKRQNKEWNETRENITNRVK